jgi:chemotaxis response regulator CheB
MCRALKVLCGAESRERLAELKRATVSTNWELVGGANSIEQLTSELTSWRPDVVVLDAAMGAGAVSAVRSVLERARIVTVGSALAGADEEAASLEDIRAAVLGLPRPGGPVRG